MNSDVAILEDKKAKILAAVNDSSRPPDWEHWKQMNMINLYQGIALSCNIDPYGIDYKANDSQGVFTFYPGLHPFRERIFHDRLMICESNKNGERLKLTHPSLCPGYSGIRIEDFVQFAVDLDWPVPSQFLELTSKKEQEVEDDDLMATKKLKSWIKTVSFLLTDEVKAKLSQPHVAADFMRDIESEKASTEQTKKVLPSKNVLAEQLALVRDFIDECNSR